MGGWGGGKGGEGGWGGGREGVGVGGRVCGARAGGGGEGGEGFGGGVGWVDVVAFALLFWGGTVEPRGLFRVVVCMALNFTFYTHAISVTSPYHIKVPLM